MARLSTVTPLRHDDLSDAEYDRRSRAVLAAVEAASDRFLQDEVTSEDIVRRVFDYWISGQYPNEADMAAVRIGKAAAPIGKPLSASEMQALEDLAEAEEGGEEPSAL